MPQEPSLLDDNGNPVYSALDDNGNPIAHNGTSAVKEPSIVSKIWDAASSPLTNAPSRFGQKVSEYIDPQRHSSGLRAVASAFAESLGNVGDSMLSPIGIGLTALSGGTGLAAKAGMPEVANALNTGAKALSAPIAYHGMHSAYEGAKEGDLAKTATGALEAAGGVFGLRSKVPGVESRFSAKPTAEPVAPEIKTPEVLDDSGNVVNNAPTNKPPELPLNVDATNLPVNKPKVKLNTDGTYSPADNQLIKFDSSGKQLPGPVDKLITALGETKPLNEQQKSIYSAERASRVAAGEEVDTPGLKGYYERLGKLKGEHTKVQTEPVKLDQTDVDSLIDHINTSNLPFYGRINASTGLVKVLSGNVPQESEVRLLESVFGKEVTDNIRAALPKIDNRRNLVQEIVNLPRALQSSYDLSFGFRQGLGLIHTKSWWNNMWGAGLKSISAEDKYNGIMDNIMSRPNYQRVKNELTGKVEPSFAEKSGLALTDLHDISTREEAKMSSLAERIPGIRASNRSYTAMANVLRTDNFDALVSQAERLYQTAKETGKARRGLLTEKFTPEQAELLNPRTNPQLAQEIAKYVNNATGRGSLGSLEKSATTLSSWLFSPRLIASRLQMLNPRNYAFQDPFIRKQYMKSMLSMATTWGTFAGLAAAAGADVSTDPSSSDFGKVKIGNTRFDPAGGFQQYLVLAYRLASGEKNNKEMGANFGAPTKGSTALDFVGQKLAPIPNAGYDYLFATKNRPFDVSDRFVRMFTPMMLQDISEILQDDPDLAKMMGVPMSAVGLGVNTYGERGGDKSVIPGVSGPKVY